MFDLSILTIMLMVALPLSGLLMLPILVQRMTLSERSLVPSAISINKAPYIRR